MELIVVDASVAAKWVLTESESAVAMELLHSEARLAAPAIIRVEVSGAILRRFRTGAMELEPARIACEDWHTVLDEGRLLLTTIEEVYDQAVELAFQTRHALADSLYLATAQHINATLVTADVTFFERARKVYDRVALLARSA